MLVTLGVAGVGAPIPDDEDNQNNDIILGIVGNFEFNV